MGPDDDQGEVAVEVFRVLKVHFLVFCVTRRDILVGGFRCFGDIYCPRLQEVDIAPIHYV